MTHQDTHQGHSSHHQMAQGSMAEAERWMRIATATALGVVLVLIVGKFFAWLVTGSVSVLSSMMDSVLDGGGSLLSFIVVRHALRPADHEHRFGHGKLEALASMAQAAFISGSALFLVFQAIRRLVTPHALQDEWFGMAVMAGAMALTAFLILVQRRALRASGSLLVAAEEMHYKGDLLTSAAVVVALAVGLVWPTWHWVDPILALLIAAYVVFGAWKIGRRALDQLMDRELADEQRDLIVALAKEHPQVHGVHDLRTRASGLQQFIQLHLELSPELTLFEAHRVSDEVEQNIRTQFTAAEVIIHQDPYGMAEPHESFDEK